MQEEFNVVILLPLNQHSTCGIKHLISQIQHSQVKTFDEPQPQTEWRHEYPGHSGRPERWRKLVHWLVVWSLIYNPKTHFCNPPVLLCKRIPASTQQQLQHNTTSFWWEDGEYFCYCVSALIPAKFIRTEPSCVSHQGARAKKERGEQWKCIWRRPCVVRIKLQRVRGNES